MSNRRPPSKGLDALDTPKVEIAEGYARLIVDMFDHPEYVLYTTTKFLDTIDRQHVRKIVHDLQDSIFWSPKNEPPAFCTLRKSKMVVTRELWHQMGEEVLFYLQKKRPEMIAKLQQFSPVFLEHKQFWPACAKDIE